MKPEDSRPIRWPLPTIGILRGGLQEIVIIGSPDYSTLIGTHVRVEEEAVIRQ
jgi:hypothetical protein